MDAARQWCTGNQALAETARTIGLTPYLNGNPQNPGQLASDYEHATALEALMAAVYFDSGKDLDVLGAVMQNLGLTYEDYLMAKGHGMTHGRYLLAKKRGEFDDEYDYFEF
jgi:dsRNA-specific ribonuclease